MTSVPIKAQLLTTYEVASGGTSCRINFVDTEGAAKAVELPVWCLQQLTLTIPKIMFEASKALYGNISLRLNHDHQRGQRQ